MAGTTSAFSANAVLFTENISVVFPNKRVAHTTPTCAQPEYATIRVMKITPAYPVLAAGAAKPNTVFVVTEMTIYNPVSYAFRNMHSKTLIA